MQHLTDAQNGAAEAILVRWLEGLRLGTAQRRGALALVAVHSDAPPPAFAYRTLEEGLASGEVEVAEQPDATVPSLRVTNRGALPVLLLDGEEVQGGKQNRVVNTTLLVPARSTFDLPVSCVEHGRWRDVGPRFEAGEAAYPSLRGQKAAQVSAAYARRAHPMADQASIWGEVAARHRQHGVASASGAMRDAYAHFDAELERARRELACPEGAVGVVALVGGRAVCADVFDRSGTLRAYWPRLVRSYGLEALGAAEVEPALDSAARLLRRPLEASRSVFRSPGLGSDVRLSGNGVVGAALVVEDAVVHTALFRWRPEPGASASDLRRPSERMRRHVW